MLEKADNLYRKARIMKNNYYHYIDKIYQSDIEESLSKIKN